MNCIAIRVIANVANLPLTIMLCLTYEKRSRFQQKPQACRPGQACGHLSKPSARKERH